jgi:hypothetical protein
MTNISKIADHDRRPTRATSCPAWCQRAAQTHQRDEHERLLELELGTLHERIVATTPVRSGMNGETALAAVYVTSFTSSDGPDSDEPMGVELRLPQGRAVDSLTPEEACGIAVALIKAAGFVEEASSA